MSFEKITIKWLFNYVYKLLIKMLGYFNKKLKFVQNN